MQCTFCGKQDPLNVVDRFVSGVGGGVKGSHHHHLTNQPILYYHTTTSQARRLHRVTWAIVVLPPSRSTYAAYVLCLIAEKG